MVMAVLPHPKFTKALEVGRQVCPAVSDRTPLYKALQAAGWRWSVNKCEWAQMPERPAKPTLTANAEMRIGGFIRNSRFRHRYKIGGGKDKELSPVWDGRHDLSQAIAQATKLDCLSFSFYGVLYFRNSKGAWHTGYLRSNTAERYKGDWKHKMDALFTAVKKEQC